jgi:small conductance mechanosensitive channel
MNFDTISAQVTIWVTTYTLRLLGAIAIWIIGSWIAKITLRGFSKVLDKSSTEVSLKLFLLSFANVFLKIMLGITALSVMGIEMTSFIAILGAAGLAIGMAFSGTLQNFAGGLMIFLFKPFRAGDMIEAQGYSGIVSEIQIFNTLLKTFDNKTIIIPNGGLATSSMINYSSEKKRRIDWFLRIEYGDNLENIRAVLKKLCDKDSRILHDPEVFVGVLEFEESAVKIIIKAWVLTSDYWDVLYAINEDIYKEFENKALNIAYPKMSVHMQKNT